MPSSYSTNLKIELQATGENSGTWGTITNTNLGTALEQAIVGYGNPNYASDANLTLTYTDTNAAQAARALVLNVTSSVSLSTTRELVVPTIQKQYIVQNNTTGSQSITVKTSAGTGITVPNGRKAHLYVNGTDVIYMDDYVDINGGAIDGTPIGANSASTGAFSTLSATGNVNFDGGTFTFNDSGADKDFRVEGDTDANLLFSDASTDRIGIGTNTPASKLDVNGTITATAVNTTTLDLTNLEVTNIKAKDGTSAASIADSTGVVSFTANPILSGGTANGVLYLNGSKVATSGSALTFNGTNLASKTFSVAGATAPATASNERITISNDYDAITQATYYGAPGTNQKYINIGWNLATYGSGSSGYIINGTNGVYRSSGGGTFITSDDYTAFGTLSANGFTNASPTFSERMRLDSTGLGIGTSSPTTPLDVTKAGGGNFVATFQNTTSATPYCVWIKDAATPTGGYPLLQVTNSAGSSVYFRVDSSTGNVGIGTSSPTEKLTVAGYARIGTGTTTPVLLTLYPSASAKGWQISANNYVSSALEFTPATANGGTTFTTPAMLLTTDGNLGIGTTSPGQKLEVAGNILINTSGNPYAEIKTSGAGNNPYLKLTADTNSWTFQGTFSNTNDDLLVLYNASTLLDLTKDGNLGLGVTPSAWGSGRVALQIGGTPYIVGTNIDIGSNFYVDSGGYKYATTAVASRYDQNAGSHRWHTAASGTAGNTITFTQAMTLDASGNLGVGTTSPSSIFEVKSATPIITLNGTTNASARGLNFQGNGTLFGSITANYSTGEMKIASGASGLSNYYLTFFTDNTERARITSGGYFKASNDGTYQGSTSSYHELRSTGAAGDWNTVVTNTTATGANAYGIRIAYTGSAPNGTGNAFLSCDDNASGATTRAVIRSNGGLANYQSNNVDLSDARTKNSITPAASMWDKIGALEIVTYKYNDQTHDDVNVGVIAQQVESVEPVWVDADGFGETPEGEEPLKTVYTKDITFAAIKALQEAMARIEKLEAEVAALKGA